MPVSCVCADAIKLDMGLRSHASQLYLTQESFGFRINCNGKSLKKKQEFTLIQGAKGVHFKTHLNKFLYGDKDGNVKGDADAPSGATEWEIRPQADGTWGLVSAHGFWLQGTGDKLTAFVKSDAPPADGKWICHLAMHPHINLYSVMRKRFVHLEDSELRANEAIPWGDDALLLLEFFEDHPDGRYGLRTCTGEYLESTGRLVKQPSAKCHFLIGFHENQISLCDEDGKYLSAQGAVGTIKSKSTNFTRDEQFEIHDSEPQFTIRDITRNFQVSNRNGAECKADQKDVTDDERFQLWVDDNGKMHLMTNKQKYMTVRADASLGADADKQSEATQFIIKWEGAVTRFQHTQTGKFLTVKPNGSIYANGDGTEDNSRFELKLINRPRLILRGAFGFLGLKGASGRVECNRTHPAAFVLDCKDGAYHLKTEGGKYWTVDQDGVAATSSAPVAFYFEFLSVRSKMLIKHAETGKYLVGEQNGGFKASPRTGKDDEVWEF